MTKASDPKVSALQSFMRALGSALRRDTPAFGGQLSRTPGGDGIQHERPGLRNASLVSADLHDAHLAHADLREANLQNADLEEADLEKADLSRADLQATNLMHARMENVKLADSIYNSSTLFPAELTDTIRRSSTEVRPGVFRVADDFVAP